MYMLNRKLIIAGVICVTILSLTACGKKKDNSVDNVKLDNNTEEITEETREETDDEFEYLYHDALKGEVLNKDEKESVQKEYKVVKGEFSSGIAEIGELVYENLMYEIISEDKYEA